MRGKIDRNALMLVVRNHFAGLLFYPGETSGIVYFNFLFLFLVITLDHCT